MCDCAAATGATQLLLLLDRSALYDYADVRSSVHCAGFSLLFFQKERENATRVCVCVLIVERTRDWWCSGERRNLRRLLFGEARCCTLMVNGVLDWYFFSSISRVKNFHLKTRLSRFRSSALFSVYKKVRWTRCTSSFDRAFLSSLPKTKEIIHSLSSRPFYTLFKLSIL